MIIIIGSLGSKIKFTGNLKPNTEKRNYVEKEMQEGTIRDSYVRAVINYNLEIININKETYDTLQRIFVNENDSLEIRDTSNGEQQSRLFISGSNLNLTENFNKKLGTKEYSGNLTIKRR